MNFVTGYLLGQQFANTTNSTSDSGPSISPEELQRMKLQEKFGNYFLYKNGGKISFNDFVNSYNKDKWKWRIANGEVGHPTRLESGKYILTYYRFGLVDRIRFRLWVRRKEKIR